MITFNDNMKTLSMIESLEENWNGYGAPPFQKELIDKVKCIIKNLDEQPEIFPTGRGTIQLEYNSKDESYLEFEIYLDRASMLLVEWRDYSTAITDSNFPINDIRNKIYTFLKLHPLE